MRTPPAFDDATGLTHDLVVELDAVTGQKRTETAVSEPPGLRRPP